MIKMKINLKILRKIICIVLFTVCLLGLVSSVNAANFKTEFTETKVEKLDNAISNTSGTAISIARIVGAAIAIIMLLVIAIKYMISSAGDRADIKKHAVAYVVGAVVLFGAVGILGILNDIAEKIKIQEP